MNTVYHFYDSDTLNPYIGRIINQAEYILCLFGCTLGYKWKTIIVIKIVKNV